MIFEFVFNTFCATDMFCRSWSFILGVRAVKTGGGPHRAELKSRMKNGPPKIRPDPDPVRALRPAQFFLFYFIFTFTLLLCISKLSTKININHCKRQAHQKLINNMSIFFYHEGKAHEISTKSRYGQTTATKNTSHLTNNINEVQIIKIPTNPPK
jgi:hypothetical protein